MKPNLENLGYGPEVLSNALVAYNYRTKHDATKMIPNEARQPKNILEVKLQLEAHKLKRKRYPDVQPDSTVRVYTKKRNFQTQRQPVWSTTKHNVNKIEVSHGQMFYHVQGSAKPLMRHEIFAL